MADTAHAAADRTILEVIRRSDHAVMDATSAARTYEMAKRADEELARRLVQVLGRTNGDVTYTVARLAATRAQIAVVLERVQRQMRATLSASAQRMTMLGVADAVEVITKLERQFSGIADVTLDVDKASTLNSIARGRMGSLLSRHSVSIERYGSHMVRAFEVELMQGILQGQTQFEMVERLTGHGGGAIRGGVFRRQEYWARRIVRTESSYAYNAANWDATREAERQFPDMGKKILAIFDRRTAPDSVYVHGQIRKTGEPFQDGAGRIYQFPPGRPNDRETVIPWRLAWPETEHSRRRPPMEVARAREASQPARERRSGEVYRTAVDDLAAQVRAETARDRRWRKDARAQYGT